MKNNTLTSIFFLLRTWVRLPFLWSIRLYQKTVSPDHGLFKHRFPYGYCKFTPTCSQYGYESIQKFGVLKGSVKTVWRIIRCNPWNKGGADCP